MQLEGGKKKHPLMEDKREDERCLERRLEDLQIVRDVISIVFIGHVDAGKSTIGGQVLNKLGLIDGRTLEKYRKQAREINRESWYLSWALDTEEAERSRGKTVELGRASFALGKRRVILLDAPGHSMYVSDMISGAGQADVAVLVISARTNEFEAGFEKGGQTKEHVYLSRASGIRKMIVLINKMDQVDWKEDVFKSIVKKLRIFLDRIYSQKDTFYIPVSGIKGGNIKEKEASCEWYSGNTFLETLECIKVDRLETPHFAFLITGKLKITGSEKYEGKVEEGVLKKGPVFMLPGCIETKIEAIYDDEDVEVEEAPVGSFVRLRLTDSRASPSEGDALLSVDSPHFAASNEFIASLTILDTQNIFCVGCLCILHLRLSRKECKILSMATLVDGVHKKKRFARRGERVLARIKTESPIVFSRGKNPDTFAIRKESLTIAIGVVKKVLEKN